VQAVVDELFGEKVDIIRWSEDPKRFVAEALAPAAVEHVEIHEADHSAFVTARDDQLSLAIGKAGQNVRLAARLTGWKIDIRSESQVAAGDVPGAKQAASRPNGSSPYDEEYDELAQEKEAVKGLDDVEQAFLSEESLEEATS
jgi:N utilization substance protein A